MEQLQLWAAGGRCGPHAKELKGDCPQARLEETLSTPQCQAGGDTLHGVGPSVVVKVEESEEVSEGGEFVPEAGSP